MSADDATARRLDEQIDAMLAGDGMPGVEHADDPMAQVAQLFLVDAATIGPMPNERALRRQLLEQVAQDPAPRRLHYVGRTAGWSFGAAWRARRVAFVAMGVLAVCTTLAFADTRTPAGKAVRVAARTMHLPVPAEPRHATARPPGDHKPTRDGADQDARSGAPDARPGSDDGRQVDGFEPRDGEFAPRGDDPRLRDPEYFDGEPKPPIDGGIRPPGEPVPQEPAPAPEVKQPLPPPDGSRPRPPGPLPGGAIPQPCCQQPAPAPQPQPGTFQPAPEPLPAPLP